jgi:hypothetical protein
MLAPRALRLTRPVYHALRRHAVVWVLWIDPAASPGKGAPKGSPRVILPSCAELRLLLFMTECYLSQQYLAEAPTLSLRVRDARENRFP